MALVPFLRKEHHRLRRCLPPQVCKSVQRAASKSHNTQTAERTEQDGCTPPPADGAPLTSVRTRGCHKGGAVVIKACLEVDFDIQPWPDAHAIKQLYFDNTKPLP